MTPDQEIEQLDKLLRQFHIDHPNRDAILRINPTTFRACTKQIWEDHGWTITDEEEDGLRGDDQKKTAALLSLLRMQHIHRIEIVPGADNIEVIPD